METVAERSAVVAVDCGTSALRVAIIDSRGEVVDREEESWQAARVTDDIAEVDCDSLWRSVCGAIKSLALDAWEVRGVGVACQLGLTLLDEDASPLRGLLWQDRRAEAEAAELSDELAPQISRVLGRPLTAEVPLAKLRWFRNNEPGVLGRTAWVVSLKDFLVYRFTGVIGTDRTHACYSGLFDVINGRYLADVAKVAGVSTSQLPPVLAASQCIGGVTPEASSATGLNAGTAVAVGGPDGTVGVLGAGGLASGTTVDVAGSTDVLFAITSSLPAQVRPGVVVNRYCLDGLWALGGPTGLTGGSVRWLSGLLGFNAVGDLYNTVRAWAGAMRPGAEGLMVVPTLSGSRFPDWDAAEAGLVTGLRQQHGVAHFLRATEEGSAFVVRAGLEALRASGLRIGSVRVVGGTAVEDWVLQLRADAWNVGVSAVGGRDTTLVGAGILAAEAAGMALSAEFVPALVSDRRCVRPDPVTARTYDAIYQRWQASRRLCPRSHD